ncbi:MAG: putative glycolipid-binding domain-containing protein [Chitinophagaceae bacterium]|nr:putative glycolipid-binding domain-containing protein [Chitinophagaceae bacterium]
MQTRIIWEGKDRFSAEYCHIMLYESGPLVQATIIGTDGGRIYKTDYVIKCNEKWHTLSLDLSSSFDDVLSEHRLRSDGRGNWTLDGKEAAFLKGCLDIDISQTPFTNSLFINRAKLEPGSKQEVNLVYIDVLQRELSVKPQQYTRLSRCQYRFANVPNDFEALVSVDDNGLVTDYEGLFRRVATEE